MAVQETPQGLILHVKVKTRAPDFSLSHRGEDFLITVTSPPENGKANQEILTELPKLLRCEVKLLRGEHRKEKIIMLKGITIEELEGALGSR